jgi:hypothetical protein
MRRVLVTALVLVVAISLSVGLWVATSGPRNYPYDGVSFEAAFPSSPTFTALAKPHWGLGGFPSSAFEKVAMWRAGMSSVVVAKLEVGKEQLLTDLRATAKIWKTSITNNDGIWMVKFTSHVKHGGSSVEPWCHGVIEVSGSEFFYALGTGKSLKMASQFVPTFHIAPV